MWPEIRDNCAQILVGLAPLIFRSMFLTLSSMFGSMIKLYAADFLSWNLKGYQSSMQ